MAIVNIFWGQTRDDEFVYKYKREQKKKKGCQLSGFDMFLEKTKEKQII